MEKEILIEFVKWLRSEYQIEEVYEMFADEFLHDRARKNLAQPDVCDVCGSEDVIEAPHMGRNCNSCHPL